MHVWSITICKRCVIQIQLSLLSLPFVPWCLMPGGAAMACVGQLRKTFRIWVVKPGQLSSPCLSEIWSIFLRFPQFLIKIGVFFLKPHDDSIGFYLTISNFILSVFYEDPQLLQKLLMHSAFWFCVRCPLQCHSQCRRQSTVGHVPCTWMKARSVGDSHPT